ncbi:MAG TPA: hypothetical protein V6D17_23975 [Candidatus Obscuribacterales bacterium]
MKFARIVYLIAGVYGILAIAPMYFLEKTMAQQTLPFNHPEFFYGFLGVTLAWQIAFLIISTDPARYRPLMFAACVEKLSFGAAVAALYALNRVAMSMVAAAGIDIVLLVLFLIALAKTAPGRQEPST